MTKRPTSGRRFSSGRANLRPIRLVLEPLEARRLLAGMDLSAAHNPVPLLTLDYCVGATTAQQSPTASPLQSQFQQQQAEGEAGVNSYDLPENATPGTLLGTIVFDDPLSGLQYTLHSEDPRFTIAGNELYFSDGELDFESEPMINIIITAVNDGDEVIATTGAVVIIADVNEQPLAIELSGGQVYEHEPGAIIGALSVVDPDLEVQDAYAFYLFDARFALSGNQLRLADGVEMDFATEPEILLAVAATDGVHEIFDTVRIQVLQHPETPVATSTVALDPRQVVELTAGASVGLATVVDPKDGDYEFSVSDERFEFVGNQLKLRNDRQVDGTLEPEISLEVTAVGDQGDEASGAFSITVTSARSAYHNYNLNEDVNGDGFVSPIDALLIINELNRRGSGPVITAGGGSGEGPPVMLDVNGDGMITPIDVLLIINHLNRTRSTQVRSVQNGSVPDIVVPEGSLEQPATTNPPAIVSDDSNQGGLSAGLDVAAGADATNYFGQLSEQSTDRRKRENASIDAELETLLDQLSHSRQAAV